MSRMSRLLPRTTIRTYSGKHIDLADPDPEDMVIDDIAVGLARACRYARQCPQWYSVAEHSWLVAVACWRNYPGYEGEDLRRLQLRALLHDASEAYLGDMPAPIKVTDAMAGYRAVEARLQSRLYERFGLIPEDEEKHWGCVHAMDKAIRTEEMDVLWGRRSHGTFGVRGYGRGQARAMFLQAFDHLSQPGCGPFRGFDDERNLLA